MLASCVALWITTSIVSAYVRTTGPSQTEPVDETSQTQQVDEQGPNVDLRIYAHGGRSVKRGEFPFLVLLYITDSENITTVCTGSITSPTTVLSSAHCDVGSIAIYAGIVNNNLTGIFEWEIQYRLVMGVRKPTIAEFFDIMICYVSHPWKWTRYVKPVALYLSETTFPPSFVIMCRVLGFGVRHPEGILGEVYVMDQLIGSGSQCLSIQPITWFFKFWMCSVNVENKTMCAADSGGPALCMAGGKEKQWGVNLGSARRNTTCGPQKTPNIYVLTGFFRKWILDNIEDISSGASSRHRGSGFIIINKMLSYGKLWWLISVAREFLCVR